MQPKVEEKSCVLTLLEERDSVIVRLEILGFQKKQHLIYVVQFCLCVCLNFSETSRCTNIKLGTIGHYPEVSVIRGFVTPRLEIFF